MESTSKTAIPRRRPRRGATLATLLFLVAALLCPLSASAVELQEIRYWSLGEITRVVVELDGEFTYKWNRLDDPPRAFFDFPGAALALEGSDRTPGRVFRIDVSDANLKQIRYAENSPGVSRVVLDLEQQCEINASQLANPARLIIELRGKRADGPPVEVSRSGVVSREKPRAIADATPPATVAAAEAGPPQQDFPVSPTGQNSPPTELAADTSKAIAPPAKTAASGSAPAAQKEKAVQAAAIPVRQPEAEPVVPPAPTPTEATEEPEAPEVAVAKPATRTANGRQSLIRALGLKIGRVVIDPGHGGKDHGTTSPKGLREKDLVLDIAQRLAKLVEDRLGSEVLLTRNEDAFVSLEERTAFANEKRADLFVSIHANSSPFKLASGSETFYLNFTTSREAMDVASRENASATRSVAELQDIVKKIALKDKRDESQDFASKVQMELYRAQKTAGIARRNRGVKAAPFIVLIGADMPSILVEVGFLSNAKEESALRTAAYKQKVAEAIFGGVEAYMRSLSHFEPTERAAARE